LSLTINDTVSKKRIEINATYFDSNGDEQNKDVFYDANEGIFTDINNNINSEAKKKSDELIYLNYSNANSLRITGINVLNESMFSAEIAWETNNIITLTGYIVNNIFNTMDVATEVNSNGCVRYGTTPGTIHTFNVIMSLHLLIL